MKQGKFLKKYTNNMKDIIMNANPDWDEKVVEDVIKDMIDENLKNPTVTMDNNFTGETRDTTLLSVLDWVLERKPIIAGNGTFYKNQHEAINPIAKMLEDFLSQRKAYKKEMFKIEDSSSDKYKDLDRSQANEKINCNSYYGASGAPSSAFYSMWSGPATTISAQSVISTAETLFEGFIADNYYFLNLTELLEWCKKVLKDFKDEDFDSFVTLHSVLDVEERLEEKILDKDPLDSEILYGYLESLSEEKLAVLYYKNNMQGFIKDHDEVQSLIIDIFEKVENLEYVEKDNMYWLKTIVPEEYQSEFVGKTYKEWNKFVNKQYFMDPNDVPESISTSLYIFKEYLMKYVYCRYLSVDRIYRLKNFKRKVVTVIDTDSNILSLDTIVDYIMDDVVTGNTFGRDHLNNIFICVNMLAYVLTTAVTDILLTYGEYSNIPEEFRPIYNMKNEFLFLLLIIGETKKRYISKIVLREGNLMNPPKYDIKGFDFKKATCSEHAEEFYMHLIKKYILDAEKIDIRGIGKEIKDFKEEIRHSIQIGERTYLPNGSAKEWGAYKNPGSVQSVKGVLAWNMLNPDNMIELPSKVSLVKLNLFNEEDILPLKETQPVYYDIILNKIFHDETGVFVKKTWEKDYIEVLNPKNKDWLKEIPKKYRTKYKKEGIKAWNEFAENYDGPQSNGHYEYNSKGLQVLAIPSNSKIPEWLLPYVDYGTMINNILSPFVPVLEILQFKTVEEGKNINGTNRKTNAITNIVKF